MTLFQSRIFLANVKNAPMHEAILQARYVKWCSDAPSSMPPPRQWVQCKPRLTLQVKPNFPINAKHREITASHSARVKKAQMTANLSIHSGAITHRLHLISVHPRRRCTSVSLLCGVHMPACTWTASLLHALSLLQRGILATRGSVHHWTGLHAMRKVGTVKHLTVHGTKVTVRECTQVLTDMCVCVAFSDRFVCIHLQTVLANCRQMYGDKHLHTPHHSSNNVSDLPTAQDTTTHLLIIHLLSIATTI